ncbi:MAG: hypothetical protein CL853_03180 [Crocinitomicaceae bacterium]|nr:hypothetical protein [Crocinitomicaceae bacterium]|tara:strand:+ start:2613 stop:2933 length:321 start_codon:yes stop_codon:yes gene_type:complete
MSFESIKTSFKLISLYLLFSFLGLYFITPSVTTPNSFYSIIDISFEIETETNSEETKKLNDLEDLFCKNYNSTIGLNSYTISSLLFNAFLPQKPILKIPIPPPELG